MNQITRLFLWTALILALGGSLFFLLSPGVQVERLAESGVIVLRPVSLYQAQGSWGATVCLLFVFWYAMPLKLHIRAYPGWAAAAGTNAVALTFLANLSLGPSYWPAALVMLAAVGLLLAEHFSGSGPWVDKKPGSFDSSRSQAR